MGNGTRRAPNPFKTGERIRECREMRGLSRKQLVDEIVLLPDNGEKERSEKQISYLENGTRALSLEYANLIAQALQVRIEYLLLKDDFKTMDERMSSIWQRNDLRENLIKQLIELHGYSSCLESWDGVTCHLQYPPGISDKEALERIHKTKPEPRISVTAPSGAIRWIDRCDYFRIVNDIDDYIEMRLSFLFRRLHDGAKEY